ncbi:MAG: prephenate dehydratase [Melioribacteraceae bacterium]|nr:prephenate dehydratase [Melioribacteraceae bacterium]MCF8264166.1 prephenate dehydratase [Melioribacteraceae bacterium]MCF8413930.1 prephenate dehydratase [Melioribacteraceae bacterium]MCF8430520.1 prephenate dehydratase [Melioribacteraceae bacterium]
MDKNKTPDIKELRDKINSIDSEIVKMLGNRYRLSEEVVRFKDVNDKPIRDREREKELLKRIKSLGEEYGLDEHFLDRVYKEIIDYSVKVQHDYLQKLANNNQTTSDQIRISIQGIEGSYSYLAGKKFFKQFGNELTYSSYKRFDEVVSSVENGEADYAMLPIENTTSGGINEVYDLLLHTTLAIVGEERYEVNHCLVGTTEIKIQNIEKVYAHYQAAAQCNKFIDNMNSVALEYFADTAMSVRKVKEMSNPKLVAIASEDAAELYGMKILAKNIANQTNNYTRFLVCARKPIAVDTRVPCKTSLVFATSHKAGSLVDALTVFRKNNLNMTKLESRPILGNPWEEMFYLDFEGNYQVEAIKQTLRELEDHTRFLKVLGSYPSQDLPPTK